MDHQGFAQLLGNYGEFVGAIGVVVTLVYLATQIRQNTHAVELSTAHSIADAFRGNYVLIGGSESVAEVFLAGLTRPESLTEAQSVQFYGILHQMVRSYEEAYYQLQEGALDQRLWTGMHRQMLHTSSLPGFHNYWRDRHDWYSDSFQEYTENTLLPGALEFEPGGRAITRASD